MTRLLKHAALLLAVLMAAMQGQPALADDGTTSEEAAHHLAPVTVSARKVEQQAQKVPASLSVFDKDDIDDLAMTTLDDLTLHVPNMHYQKIGPHYTLFNYRGISGVNTMSKTWNVNVDGATLPYIGLDTLFDVERIEVLRGGQGSLYGRNTHAGVINIVTPDPGPEFEAELDTAYGSFNTQRTTGSMNLPINDVLGARLALQQTSTDGYMESIKTGDDDTDSTGQKTGRVKFVLDPGTGTRAELSLFADSYAGHNDAWINLADGRSYDSPSGEDGWDDGSLSSGTLTVDHEFDFATLTSISAYSHSDYKCGMDMDVSEPERMTLDYREYFRTFTQELRLASPDPDAEWTWLAGAFLLHEDSNYNTAMDMQLFNMRPNSKADMQTNGYALFGQAAWDFAPGWELTAGLRVDHEHKDFSWENVLNAAEKYDDDKAWTAVLPSASLSWEFRPDQTAYASVNRGYRVGDYVVNVVRLATLKEKAVLDPEYAWNYELGYKSMHLDRTLRLNAAVFYSTWEDMQVTAVSNGMQIRENAGKAHSYGAELEARWLAAPGLTLFGNAGVMEAKYDEYGTINGRDPKGNWIPNTCENSFGVGAVYQHDSGFFVTGEATRFGRKYLESQNDYKQDPYTMLNAQIGWREDAWHVALVGRNLGRERYVVRGFENQPGMVPARMGAPLTLGLEAGVKF